MRRSELCGALQDIISAGPIGDPWTERLLPRCRHLFRDKTLC